MTQEAIVRHIQVEDMTPEEKADYEARLARASEQRTEKAQKAARKERDRRMDAFQWRLQRHAREVRLGLTPTDNIADLDAYMQALADVTAQAGFPDDITWPEEPA